MTLDHKARLPILLGLALISAVACAQYCFAQTVADKTDRLVVQQPLDELASYMLSDSEEVNHAYNLLAAILPHVKSLRPSLYPQAAAQLSSLMSRVPNTRSQSEEIDERIRTSSDPLAQIITEARSA